MMKPIPTEYYGDNSRWFIATVVNSTPPAGYEGRVKIRVHGLHSESTKDIPEDHLPWAQCVLPTTEGGVSGIGKMPRVLPSALVFGFFVDGVNSQTPIVVGSLPKTELPSEIQKLTKQTTVEEGVILASTLDIQDSNKTNGLSEKIITRRKQFCLQFFLNLGYSLQQSAGITENLGQNNMTSGASGDNELNGFGVGKWTGERFKNLKAFSSSFSLFSKQLEFIAFELRGTQRSANIRLLETERFGGEKGSLNIFAKYYLKKDLKELDNLKSEGDYE